MEKLDFILSRVTKPARYTGGEWNSVVKDWESTEIKVAISYPDVYEIGMSNLGLAIIYDLLNKQPDVLAERVFTPWVDMEDEIRKEKIPLFSLESKHPVGDFDILGFSLGYELTYTNVLNILDLAGMPVLSEDRDDTFPLVIAGGSSALNPEPMAEFIDLFVVGEGEEVVLELIEVYREWKRSGTGKKKDLLREALKIRGIYVPGFYDVEYNPDGTVVEIAPAITEAPSTIERRIVNKLPAPLTKPIVPCLQIVHDRAAVEIQRGCYQGCRFCQAGVIYRPVRVRKPEEVVSAVKELRGNCGYDEISLLSLSTSDYPGIADLINKLSRKYAGENLIISMPSLRLDSFSVEMADSLIDGKKTGFTFAPEAGTERLRHAINKCISEEEILRTVETAWERGWKRLKLYFMIGLPGETMSDVEGIVDLVFKIRKIGNGRINIRVNISTYVPKAHTPFQWVAQNNMGELEVKQQVLRTGLKKAGVQVSWQSTEASILEGVMSRGDRRLGRVIKHAWQNGSKYDAWSEHFDFEKWQKAFRECGIDPYFYTLRERPLNEVLPWSHIDTGVSINFLKKEYERAGLEKTTPKCSGATCNVCGLQTTQDVCQKKYRDIVAVSKRSG